MPIPLKNGQKGLISWEENPRSDQHRAKAGRFDGLKTKKIILPENGFNPLPGEAWFCEVVLETNPESQTKGAYFVKGLAKREGLVLPADIWVDPDVATEIAQDLASPEANIMLVGPQGCGKTVLSQVIAESLGYVFHAIDCTLVRNKIDWFGTRELGVEDGATVTIWQEAELAKALRAAHEDSDKTHVVFLDELNRCPMDARNAILRIIYGQDREACLPNGDKIPVGGNVVFIAAVNEGSAFGGVAGMDAAFADRWCRHKMGYPPADVERGILRQRHGQANELDLAAVVAVANSLRQRFVAGDIPKTCSMRATLNAARRLSLGSSLKRALVSAIVNQYEGDMSDPSSDAGRVWSYIRGTVPADRLQ